MTIDLAKLTNLATALQERSAKPKASGQWYEIKNLTTDSVEVFLYDEIGGWGVTAADFISELRDLKTSAIELHINSPGGSVFDGVAIFTALVNHPATVTVVIDAVAASAASFIAMAASPYDATKKTGGVRMAKHARMMIHDASGMCWGRAKDMREMADLLDSLSDTIAEAYYDRAGGTVAEWRAIMEETDKWYTAKQAVAAGLADHIQGEDSDPPESVMNVSTVNVVTVDDARDAGGDITPLLNSSPIAVHTDPVEPQKHVPPTPAPPPPKGGWNLDADAFAELIRKAF